MHMLYNAAGYDVPPWVRKGAAYDFDWVGNRFWKGHTIYASQNSASDRMKSTISGGGNSTANSIFAPDSNGQLYSFPANALRRTNRGLWCENTGNTNYVGNSRQITAPNGWTIGATMTTSVANIPGADGGQVSSVAKSAGGSNFAVGDLVTLQGGIVVKVATLTGSAINTVTLIDKAIGAYQTIPANPVAMVSTNGSGSGATFNITWTSKASRLTAGATTATNTVSFAITQASASFTSSCYMRRVTGSGPVYLSTDGGTTKTDISGQLNSNTFTKVEIPAQTLANPTFWIRVDTSGDVVDVDMCQCANNIDGVTNAATPIVTTTSASLTRSGEALFWNNPSVSPGYNNGWPLVKDILQQRPYSIVVECDGNGASASLAAGTDQSFLLTGGCDGSTVSLGGYSLGTITSSNTGNFGLGNTNKIGGVVGNNSSAVGLNGVITTGTFKTGQTLTSGTLLNIALTNPGSGYTPGTYSLGFSGGGGTLAAGSYVVDGTGTVVQVYITNIGQNYTSAPTVSFPSGGGSGAAATAYLGTISNSHGGMGSHNNTATNANNQNGPTQRCTIWMHDITLGQLKDCVT